MIPSQVALLLGGALAPIGLSTSFLRRPMQEVRDALLTWRREELHQTIEETRPARFPACVSVLEPLEAPWTTELIVDCGDWTAYLNNGIDGGDPSAAAPYLGVRLGCDCIVAVHAPPHGPGHASTQLRISGPDGEPPSMRVRTIAAHAEDGRWSWNASGPLQPFELPERYSARRKRDRLDRPLLVRYLEAIGLRVDDDAFYGDGLGLRQVVKYRRRQETLDEVRARFGW
jgi:hypothetical protein